MCDTGIDINIIYPDTFSRPCLKNIANKAREEAVGRNGRDCGQREEDYGSNGYMKTKRRRGQRVMNRTALFYGVRHSKSG